MPLLELEQKIQHELLENPALELSELKDSDNFEADSFSYEEKDNTTDSDDDVEFSDGLSFDLSDFRHRDDIDYNWSEIYDDSMPKRSYEDDDEQFDLIANTEESW